MIKSLRHVGLVVSDMDRAIRFYEKLGCEVISREAESWVSDNQKHPAFLEVCKMTNNVELITGFWKHHVAFTVNEFPDLDDEQLPYSIMWQMNKPGVKFITDPDGNVIELVKGEK